MNDEMKQGQLFTESAAPPEEPAGELETPSPAPKPKPSLHAPAPVIIPAGGHEHPEPPAPLWQKVFLFLIAALIILADQFTKRLVEQNIPLGQSVVPIDSLAEWFQFTHTTNTGAAFGLFPGGGTLFAVVAVIVSIVIVIYALRLPAGHLLLRVALGLQLGGAIGNLIDRARQGYVTDFFDVGPVPIFNIADAAVVTGVALMALIIFMETQAEQKAAREARHTTDAASAPPETPPAPRPFTTLPAQPSDEHGTH